MDVKLIGVFEAVKSAWELVQKNLIMFLVIGVGPQLVYTVLAMLILAPYFGNDFNPSAISGFSSITTLFSGFFLLTIISILVGALISLLQVLLIIKLDRGEAVTFSSLLNDALKILIKYAVVQIMVSVLVLVGLILLVVPGIIFGLWFFAATYIVVDQGKSGTNALKASKELVSGYTGDVFMRFFVGILLLIAVMIVVGLFTAPLTISVGQNNAGVNIVESAINGFVGVLSAAYSFMIYKSLKQIKGSSSAPAVVEAKPVEPSTPEPAPTPAAT